jgi:fumarate hydratase class II
VRWTLTGESSGNARLNIPERVIGSSNHAGSARPAWVYAVTSIAIDGGGGTKSSA